MVARVLHKISSNILVIGSIYDQIFQLKNLNNILDKFQYVIINGNMCHPYKDLQEIRDRISFLTPYLKSEKVIYNLGNYDLELAKSLYDLGIGDDIIFWIENRPNVIILEFKTQFTVIITNGGLAPNMSKDCLKNNLETSFISNNWHSKYNGMQGYVVSNNPATQKPPQFYKYSAQIGNLYGDQMGIYAQEITPHGLKNTTNILKF